MQPKYDVGGLQSAFRHTCLAATWVVLRVCDLSPERGKLSVCAVKIDVGGRYHFILLLLSQYINVYLSPPFSVLRLTDDDQSAYTFLASLVHHAKTE